MSPSALRRPQNATSKPEEAPKQSQEALAHVGTRCKKVQKQQAKRIQEAFLD